MIVRFRKLSRVFEALAFANVGNLGEFRRALAETAAAAEDPTRRDRAAARQQRRPARYDPRFAGWMAKWDAMAASAAGRVEALEIENAHLRRRLDCALRDRDDLLAALARQDRVPGIAAGGRAS